jgi:hypothetical protein
MKSFQVIIPKPPTAIPPHPCLWVLEVRKEAWWSCGATHCSDGLGYDFPLTLGRIPSTPSSNTLHTHTYTQGKVVDL